MTAKITVMDNGNLRIEGDFEIFDSKGGRYDMGGRSKITLCRCGQSEDMPFCDGSHNKCGFKSEVVAYALPPKNG